MEIKYSGLASFLFVLSIVPLWFLTGFVFSFLNIQSSGSNYFYYNLYWIVAVLWAATPGLIAISKLIYIWSAGSQIMPLWDMCLGVMSIILMVFILVVLYKFQSMRIASIL